MTLEHAEGLIDINSWHTLSKKYASTSPQSRKKSFSYLVLKFIQQLDESKEVMHLAICCGDSQRFPEVYGLIQDASDLEWQCDIFLTPELEDQWQQFIEKLQVVVPVYLTHQLGTNSYHLVFDCIAQIATGSLSADQQDMILHCQSISGKKISLDIPSGLHPNTGYLRDTCVFAADMTLCRYAYFQGLFSGVAKEYTGLSAILLPDWPMILNFSSYLLTQDQMLFLWPKRRAFVSKSDFKRVKVLAGQESMFGASVLVAYAALVMGAGRVEVYYQRGFNVPIGEFPEIIWHPIDAIQDLQSLIEPDDILVMGPGLGFDTWGQALWSLIKDYDNQMVVDASALHYLAQEKLKKPNWIITPHPGEAAKLLDCSVQKIQADRFAALKALSQHYQSLVVLKGSGTLMMQVSSPIYVCPLGNSGMATPGMGDTLCGLIAGCLAQMTDSLAACQLAVWLHASAADQLMEKCPAMIVRPKKLIKELQNHMQDVLCKSNLI